MASLLVKLVFLINCFVFYVHCSIIQVQHRLSSNNVTLRKLIPSDRTYYIGAIEVLWDYTPNATNPFTGIPVQEDETASVFTETNDYDRIGSIYTKAVYREFTDDTFTEMVERDENWLHLGVVGPPIRGVVGDRIKIVFFNNCTQNYSMHPHGVSYNKKSEGGMYEHININSLNKEENWFKSVSEGGQKVTPGEQWVYIWDVRDEFNYLSANEFTSKMWMYHSHIHEPMDTNTGLVGPLIITKKGKATSSDDPTPKDVDREFVTLFTVFDENLSWYLQDDLRRIVSADAINGSIDNYIENFDYEDEDFEESNLMHTMNGFGYNVLGQYMEGIKLGEKVRWYIGAMGTEVDLHTAHWHGNIIVMNNFISHDVVQLLPAFTTEVDMTTDNPGTWFYHCHVNDHVEAGMIATYQVLNETCNECYGNNNDQFVDETQDDDDKSFGEVLGSSEAWSVVFLSAIINVIILIIVLCIYSRFMGGARKGSKEYLKSYGGVGMGDMSEKLMTDDKNKGVSDDNRV